MSEKDDYWFDLGYEKGKAIRDAEIAELQKAIDDNWVTHQQIVAANKERDRLREQVTLYEQALLASWPEGAMGDAFDFWNAARKLAATGTKP